MAEGFRDLAREFGAAVRLWQEFRIQSPGAKDFILRVPGGEENPQFGLQEPRMIGELAPARGSLAISLEQRWYRVGTGARGNEQFVVADPDGYLLRFFTDLGHRELPAS